MLRRMRRRFIRQITYTRLSIRQERHNLHLHNLFYSFLVIIHHLTFKFKATPS